MRGHALCLPTVNKALKEFGAAYSQVHVIHTFNSKVKTLIILLQINPALM